MIFPHYFPLCTQNNFPEKESHEFLSLEQHKIPYGGKSVQFFPLTPTFCSIFSLQKTHFCHRENAHLFTNQIPRNSVHTTDFPHNSRAPYTSKHRTTSPRVVCPQKSLTHAHKTKNCRHPRAPATIPSKYKILSISCKINSY